MITKKIIKAHTFALSSHKDQMYGDVPYSVHLTHVVMTALKFIHNIKPELREMIIQACWLHDTIEDTNIMYDDIKKYFGEFVADVVYAVTNEKGKNRKERNEKTIAGIAQNRYAVFIKLCDKIANTEYSKLELSRMHALYSSEYPHFRECLYIQGEYEDVWDLLDELSKEGQTVALETISSGHSEK
jgi:(p)ppGpp synthase/HD superfamily hydrolase